MVDGVYSKLYSKQFQEETLAVNGGYPVYRRRNNDLTFLNY